MSFAAVLQTWVLARGALLFDIDLVERLPATERGQARFNPDQCGDAAYLPLTFATNSLRTGEIQVPALLLFGTRDPLFTPGRAQRQAALFSMTLTMFDGAAHGPP